MKKIIVALLIGATTMAVADQVTVQFARGVMGRNVRLCIDGKIETTFAGKLGFRDQYSSWTSVCANVRAPITNGQYFGVELHNSAKAPANYVKAGNIVAKAFNEAQTPDQCAGLQLAVWEAIEDGQDQPDFLGGHFQAPPSVIAYAQHYYGTYINVPGSANLIWATLGQSQIFPTSGS
jgi:hypothetical protein